LLARQLAAAPQLFDGFSGGEAGVLFDALLELALVIVVTVSAFFILRGLAKRLDRRIGARAADKGMIETAALVVVSLLVDVAVVLLAWATGYAVATLALGAFGTIGIREALYLNAFLAVELVKVGVRTILSPTTGELRPISIPDAGARRLNVWVSVVVSVLGYGQLLIVPIIAQHVSWLAGQGMGVLVSILAIALLAAMVLTYRRRVSDWLLSARNMASGSRPVRFFARNWHVPVLLYLAALLLIVFTRPGAILLPVLGASAQILGAIVVGSIAASAISRSIRNGVHLPPQVNQRLPLLERRLNAFVPKALIVLQILIILAVLAFAFHTIGLIDLRGWLAGRFGAAATAALFSVAFILVISFLVWLAISSYIDYRLNPDFGAVPTARESTLLALARNALTVILMAVTLMFT
ncbi:MAG: mechanosensitive ion channel protein MscS, partial [Alphaproteobacteria bacterium]